MSSTYQNYIGGRFVSDSGDGSVEVTNPATQAVLGHIPEARNPAECLRIREAAFVDKVSQLMSATTFGDPGADASVGMGPLINASRPHRFHADVA